jgi:hypothetical protein
MHSEEIKKLINENAKLKEENEKLKNAFFVPKIVNNVFDYFIWINRNISIAIEHFEEKKDF